MDEKLIIVDTKDKSQMEFDYPEDIDNDNSPIYASEDVIGRATPIYQFVSGGDRTYEFDLNIYWSKNEKEVEQKVSWLRSLTFPEIKKTGDIEGAPHPVLLVMGKLFQNIIFIVENVSPHYHSLFHPETGLPCYATVRMRLVEHRRLNANYKTIRRFR